MTTEQEKRQLTRKIREYRIAVKFSVNDRTINVRSLQDTIAKMEKRLAELGEIKP